MPVEIAVLPGNFPAMQAFATASTLACQERSRRKGSRSRLMRNNERPAVKVLVADDSTTVRRLVSARLEADGYEVVEAEDGLQALELARTERPSLLLLDKVMPKLDGFEVVRRLKADAQTRGLPIVILSEQANEREVLDGLELGVDEYMTKPFSLRELSLRVSQLLGRGSGSA